MATPDPASAFFDRPDGASDDAEALLVGLNVEQRHAVTIDTTPLAVHAGAGSGKTRVLTRRIAWRALTGLEDPRRVLALTFTRKAAGELRSRLRRLGLRDQVAAGTFHAVAYAQLRTYWRDRDQREPDLLDRKMGFITSLLPRDRRTTDALDVLGEIEWAKARRIRPETYAEAAERLERDPALALPIIARIYRDYEDLKAERQLVDFDDLLDGCAKAIRSDKAFADAQRWRFRHLYVDEFQDVNPLQFALLNAWLGGRDDLCAVGDPDQAIYGWNGADADHLMRFTSHFQAATVVELRQNYRSTPQILQTAAAALAGRSPMLANRPSGEPATVTDHPDDRTEAAAVARRARDAKGPTGRWVDQAVLVRTNAQAELISGAFRDADIPVRTRAGSGLLDRADVKGALAPVGRSSRPLADLLSDLRHDADPESGDDGAGHRDEERAAAFAEVRRLADEFLALDPGGTGAGFVSWARGQARAAHDESIDAVEIATFHAAKGLEWPIVHVAGLEAGLVPIGHARGAAAYAEERRLLYVALSRAEDRLHLSWAATRKFGDRTTNRSPSPWLVDVEAAIAGLDRPLPRSDQAHRAGQVRDRVRRSTLPPSPVVDALKAWRLDRARAADIEPYLVFRDVTIESLVERWPASVDELLDVTGIGPVKARRFGPELLAVLDGFEPPERPAAPPVERAAPTADHGPADASLVDALRTWRNDHRDGKPAYTVFTDATMRELAAVRPTTADELLAVSGIGPAKLARFGDELLALLAEQD